MLCALVQGCSHPEEWVPPADLGGGIVCRAGVWLHQHEQCQHKVYSGRRPMLVVALDLSGSDLSEPVDVYSDWIDACEAANQ